MAIVANGDVEKLKSVDCSTIKETEKSEQIDLSILSSIYKIKKGHKFSEEGAKKRTRPTSGNHKMTNGASSPSPPNGSTSASKVNGGSPDSANWSDANCGTQSADATSVKTPSPPAKVQSREHSNAPINSSISSAKSNAPSIATRSPPASNQIDSALRLMSCKQSNQPTLSQPSLSAIQNGLTASPPLPTANKFSIANILNENCEATSLDSYRRPNQQIDLPPNAGSLLVPNMMLNQNDLNALSSFNLIAWQASYAAQHAQAGNYRYYFNPLN